MVLIQRLAGLGVETGLASRLVGIDLCRLVVGFTAHAALELQDALPDATGSPGQTLAKDQQPEGADNNPFVAAGQTPGENGGRQVVNQDSELHSRAPLR